jgi:hypothetical protein
LIPGDDDIWLSVIANAIANLMGKVTTPGGGREFDSVTFIMQLFCVDSPLPVSCTGRCVLQKSFSDVTARIQYTYMQTLIMVNTGL